MRGAAVKNTRLAVVVFGALLGVAGGLGVFTFGYAKGHSYLSNRPAACVNCHAMNDVYASWGKSSHHAAATCNDCHTPGNPVAKYAIKLSNGFFHSFAFTSGRYPDAIQIKRGSLQIANASCRRCHADIVTAVEGVHRGSAQRSCVRCHTSVGHLEHAATASLEETP